MKIDAAAVRKCLKSFDFATLFREHLGWDNHHARLDILAGETTFGLTAIAQKRGFVAYPPRLWKNLSLTCCCIGTTLFPRHGGS
jgi:hypothetical protein